MQTPTVEMAPPKTRVEEYKTDGNNAFKKHDFTGAIKYYTKAIAADHSAGGSFSSVLYSNRAFCHLKLGHFEECLIDCNDSLRFDPGNQKTLYRRMCANHELNNETQVQQDYQAILRLNPEHAAAKEFMAREKPKAAHDNSNNTSRELWEKL